MYKLYTANIIKYEGGFILQIKLQMKGLTLIASLGGELDHHSAKKVKDMLEAAIINKAAQNLVFDLTNLTFMDSSGIGVIIGRYKLIKSLGGNVCIASNNSSINRLISLSGLMRLMEVYETADLATESIQGGR